MTARRKIFFALVALVLVVLVFNLRNFFIPLAPKDTPKNDTVAYVADSSNDNKSKPKSELKPDPDFERYKQELKRYKARYDAIPEVKCVPKEKEEFTRVHPYYPPEKGELVALPDDSILKRDPQISLYCSHTFSGPFVRRNPLTFSSLQQICKPFFPYERGNLHQSWCLPSYIVPEHPELIDYRHNNTLYPFPTDLNIYQVRDATLFQDVIFTSPNDMYLPIVHDSDAPFLIREMGFKLMKDKLSDYQTLSWDHNDVRNGYDIFHRIMLKTHRWNQKTTRPPLDNALKVRKLVYAWMPWDNHVFHGLYEFFPLVISMKQQIMEDPEMFVRMPEKSEFLVYFFNLVGIPKEKLIVGYDNENGLCCTRPVQVDELYVATLYPAPVLQQPHLDNLKMIKTLGCKNVKPVGYLWEEPTRQLRVAFIQHGAGISKRSIETSPIREYSMQHNISFVEIEDMRNYKIPEQLELLASFDILIATMGSQTMMSFCCKPGTHFISIMSVPDMFIHHYTTAQGMNFWPIISLRSNGERFPHKYDLEKAEWDEIIKIIETVKTRRY